MRVSKDIPMHNRLNKMRAAAASKTSF